VAYAWPRVDADDSPRTYLMDLRQYLRLLRSHSLVIVGSAVVCGLLAAAVIWTKTPIYSAHTQLFVANGTGGTLSQTYQGSLFSQQRVLSYAHLVSSPYVLRRVIVRLKLDGEVRDLQREIKASVPLNTVLIDITVRDASPSRAQAIANSLGAQFARFASRLETSGESRSSPVSIRVASPALLPTNPVSPRKRVDLTLGVVLGALLGVGVAVTRRALQPAPRLVQAPPADGPARP
jgi:polysaccharide biosynthesis transport protein